MKRLENKANVTAASTDWPYGDARDKTPSLAGTLWDKEMMSDILQFFEKMFSESGITANGSLDNATNGFQLFEAFQKKTRGYAVVRGVLKDGSFTQFENDTGETITYSKVSSTYKLTASGAIFSDAKTFVLFGNPFAGTSGTVIQQHYDVNSSTVIDIDGFELNSSGSGLVYGSENSFISSRGIHLEIRVYP